MVTKTNEQALEQAIEQVLTGTSIEQLKESGTSVFGLIMYWCYFLFCCSLMVFLSISNLLVSISCFKLGFVGLVCSTFLLNFFR